MLSHEMSHFFANFSEKFIKTSKHVGFLEKSEGLAKSMIFHVFSRNQRPFATFLRKVHENLET